MSIEQLPQVQIGNSNLLFNGYIYNLSFDVAAGWDGENATTLTVSVASEDGTYSIDDSCLDTAQVYNVTIGNFKLTMFLESYRLITSSKGNLLEVTFIDGSFQLDKFWVGLNKSVWDLDDSTLGPKPNFIICVGNEMNPCDVTAPDKSSFPDVFDPCDPCITQTMRDQILAGNATTPDYQRWLLDCQEAAMTQIFDVQYSFDDLIYQAMIQTGIRFVNAYGLPITSPNPYFKQKYTGTLREVLRSWCSDFGWSFFFTNNQVIFIDSTHTIQVSANLNDYCPNLSDYVEEHTLKGTVAGNFIAHFKRPGQIARDYICKDAAYITLNAYAPNFTPPNSTLALTNTVDKTAAGLCLYHEYLRDLYYWFVKYQMYDPITNMSVNQKIPELGLVILSVPISINQAANNNGGLQTGTLQTGSLQTDTLDPSIQLDFPTGYPTDQADKAFLDAVGLSAQLSQVQQDIQNASDIFQKCFNQLAPKEQWAFAQNAYSNYFFIAYYDPAVEAQHIQEERDYASEFMGKYYVYAPDMTDPIQSDFFEDDRIISDITKCSNLELIDDGKLQFHSLNKNEDSIVYWNAPAVEPDGDVTTLSRLPFAKFLKIFRNSVGGTQNGARKENFKLLTVTVEGDRFFPAAASKGTDSDNDSSFPIQDADLIKNAHSFYINKVGSKLDDDEEDVCAAILNSDPSTYANLDATSKDSSKVFLFWGGTAKDTDFKLTNNSTWYHETQRIGYKFDGIPLNERVDAITNANQIVYKYPALRCKQMARYNNLTNHVALKTPTATFEYSEPSLSAYGVVIEKQKTISVRTERMQKCFVYGYEPTSKVLSVNINQYDFSDDDIRRRTFGAGTCKYNEQVIQALFDERKVAMTYVQETPLIKKTFTVGGVASVVPNIEQGLMGIEMSLDNEEGLKTTYTFGTLLMKIPKPDIWNGLEFRTPRGNYASQGIMQPYQQPVGSGD